MHVVEIAADVMGYVLEWLRWFLVTFLCLCVAIYHGIKGGIHIYHNLSSNIFLWHIFVYVRSFVYHESQ